MKVLNEMNFPINTDFIVSHKFGYVVPRASVNSGKSLTSFSPYSLTKLLLSRELFSFHEYVDILLLLLLLKCSLSLWRSDKMHGIMSIF